MTVSASDLEYLRDLVYRCSAIVLDATRGYLVEQRLGELAHRESLDGFAAVIRAARAAPGGALETKVVEAMTTNETSFFRDGHPFATLEREVAPKLMAARSDRRLEIWSAACSTGQEPYSIAMSLKHSSVARGTVRITATDLSTEVIEKARLGVFSQLEVNRGLPAPMLSKYFVKKGTDFQASDALRSMIDFRVQNLLAPYSGRYDVVFLRNVLIYFDLATKRAILRRVREVLRPDGYLFLGGSETTLNVDPSFQVVAHGKTLCYRVAPAASASRLTG